MALVTDWKFPATGETIDRDGKQYWINPENIYICDGFDSAATFIGGYDYSDWLRATNFGFTSSDIPSGAVIVGIEMAMVAMAAPGGKDSAIYARKTSGQVGTSQASDDAWPDWIGAEVYRGGSDNLWGVAWERDDIVGNSDFGFDISVLDTNGSNSNKFVDCVKCRVYYEITSSYPMPTSKPSTL